MPDLLNADDALNQILAQIGTPQPETVATENALGRVLLDDTAAPIDLPPFANSAMDGYAVRSADLAEAPVTLTVAADIPAGAAPDLTLQPGQAARIMTGAPLPAGADTVVPVENTDAEWQPEQPVTIGSPVAIQHNVDAGANIRPVGENIRTGERVLSAGTVLQPQDIGMLIGLGIASIRAARQPRVAILSTGDELVGVSDPLTPGKIRDTNSHTIAGLVTQAGGIPHRLPPAKDTLDAVHRLFDEALALQPDLIVSSAGVSVGSYDVVRRVLDDMGEIGFWRVNVRPGKPLAFGQVQNVPFFGLPGNPVSAVVTFGIFVRPALMKLQGRANTVQTITAITGEAIRSDGRRTYVRVVLQERDGQWIATTTGTQSSGALMSMVLADGLLIIPEGTRDVAAGTALPVQLLRA